MDYLHGDVADHQFRAACRYEYARKSAVVRAAVSALPRLEQSLEEQAEESPTPSSEQL